MPKVWLRTDERADILASLCMISSSCEAAITDLSAWKWIVIGTHSALQGVMTLHLGLGNNFLVARPKNTAAWLKAHKDGTPYPELMMDNFLSLYKKLKKHDICGYRFKPNGTQGRSIRKINDFRNEFIHFIPKGWSIEISGMPAICLDCLEVVANVGKHSLHKRWESEEQQQSFEKALSQCQSKLSAFHIKYATPLPVSTRKTKK
ncbi:MAG: hypothetical protein ABW154_02325 [Dyella sp.]